MSKLSQQRRYANLSDEKIEEELNKINPNVKVTSFGIQITLYSPYTIPDFHSRMSN